MIDEEDLILEFEVPYEPVLANDMYRAVKSKARGWAVMAKSNSLIKYHRMMRKELPNIIPEDKAAKFKYAFSTGVYDIVVESIHHVPFKRYYNFDVSNLIKAYEDSIVEFLGIDDSFTSKYIVEKVPTISDSWLIKTKMTLVKKSPLVV